MHPPTEPESWQVLSKFVLYKKEKFNSSPWSLYAFAVFCYQGGAASPLCLELTISPSSPLLPFLQRPGGRATLLPANILRKQAEVYLLGLTEKESGPWRAKGLLRKKALNQTQISRILARGLEKIAIKVNCFLYKCSLYLDFPQCAILSLRLGEQMRFWKCWLTYPFVDPFPLT